MRTLMGRHLNLKRYNQLAKPRGNGFMAFGQRLPGMVRSSFAGCWDQHCLGMMHLPCCFCDRDKEIKASINRVAIVFSIVGYTWVLSVRHIRGILCCWHMVRLCLGYTWCSQVVFVAQAGVAWWLAGALSWSCRSSVAPLNPLLTIAGTEVVKQFWVFVCGSWA